MGDGGVLYTRKEEMGSVLLGPFQSQLDGATTCFFFTVCVCGVLASIINPKIGSSPKTVLFVAHPIRAERE